MEQNKVCRNCGSKNVRLIPAGISKKTGKKYDAFYSCKDCNTTEKFVAASTPKMDDSKVKANIDELYALIDNLDARLTALESKKGEKDNLPF